MKTQIDGGLNSQESVVLDSEPLPGTYPSASAKDSRASNVVAPGLPGKASAAGQFGQSTRRTPPAHMPALDGVRGLAILLVLFFHSNLATGEGSHTPIDKFLWLAYGSGWLGVDLFFVLSGFLITGILLSTKESPSYYTSFFARRSLRIFPLYYGYLFLALALHHRQVTFWDVASLLLFFYNLRVVHTAHVLPWVHTFWSLAVEEQFYLVWPFLVRHLRTATLIKVCICGFFAALLLREVVFFNSNLFPAAYNLTPCRMDELLLGSLLAILRGNKMPWNMVQRWSTRTACVAASALVAIALWGHHFFATILVTNPEHLRHSSVLVIGPGMSLAAILFGSLIVKATRQGLIFRIFVNRPLRALGKYSYGMYVLHLPILALLSASWRDHSRIPLASGTGQILFPVLVVACTFGCAVLSFQVFERRFLALKKRHPALPPERSINLFQGSKPT